MKRKMYSVFVLFVAVVTCTFGFTACDNKHNHEFDDWTITMEPKCEDSGEETRFCKKDNTHQEKRPIAALGHDWGSKYTIDTPATCTEVGSKSRFI
jgi:hypothetical protein